MQWYHFLIGGGIALILLICIAGALIQLSKANTVTKRHDNSSSGSGFDLVQELKCPCGRGKAVLLTCCECNDATGICSACRRRLLPCKCVRMQSQDAGPLPPPLGSSQQSEHSQKAIELQKAITLAMSLSSQQASCLPPPTNHNGETAHVQSLQRQLDAMKKQNCELTESVKKCIESRRTNEMSQIPNYNSISNRISNGSPTTSQGPICSIPKMGTQALREQLEHVQIGISLADMIDMNREIQGELSSNSEANVQRELIETLKQMKSELKEVNQQRVYCPVSMQMRSHYDGYR